MRVFLFSTFLLVGLVSASAYARLDDFRPLVIGGVEVTPSDPIAGVTVGVLTGSGLCSGSLLAEDLVITAAHCVGHGSMKIVFGIELKTPGLTTADVIDTAVPQGFTHSTSGKDRNDIALLLFKGGLPAGYSPVKLLPPDAVVQAGETVTIAGYGRVDASQSSPRILNKADVLVLDPNYAKTETKLDKSHGKGSCKGDSGGPAFVIDGRSLYLYALDNWGDSACSQFSVYVKVAAHSEWIQSASATLRKQHLEALH